MPAKCFSKGEIVSRIPNKFLLFKTLNAVPALLGEGGLLFIEIDAQKGENLTVWIYPAAALLFFLNLCYKKG